MKKTRLILSALLLIETFALSAPAVWPAEGIVSKVPDPSGSYCLLIFPAIREETLYWDRPVLKHPGEGDLISFYGPCNYDPLGKVEIQRQREEWHRIQRRDAMDGE